MNQNKLIVISPYPPRNSLHGSKYSAIASYAKNTINSIRKSNQKTQFIVIADILDEKEIYKENGDIVCRVWRRNSPSIFFEILKIILQNAKSKKVLFEFEFGMFGGNKILILIAPFFLLLLRILGKEVYLVNHSFISSSQEVSVQLEIGKSRFIMRFYDIGLKILYLLLVRISDKTIVFEESMKSNMVKSLKVSRDKIVVIPHGVEDNRKIIDKALAREKLNIPQDEFIILCFGFLIWYKGSDWLIDTFSDLSTKGEISSKIRLIMAGDFSKIHRKDKIYQKYVVETENKLRRSREHIEFTGFIPEDRIDLYFSAADLIILPHRVLISASGPFSFAISHKKPFILSSALNGYALNKDFRTSMHVNNIHEDEVFFDGRGEKDLGKLINYYYSRPESLKKLSNLSVNLLSERAWFRIGRKYYETIF